MSKGPKTSTQTQQTQANTYGWQTPQDTPDINALRNLDVTGVDPGIGYTYGAAKRRVGETFNNPFGSYTTPAIREATERSAYGDLAQQEGAATQQASYENSQLDLARKEALAAMTRPQLVSTGGSTSGTGTSQQSGGVGQMLLGGAVSGGASGASAGLM